MYTFDIIPQFMSYFSKLNLITLYQIKYFTSSISPKTIQILLHQMPWRQSLINLSNILCCVPRPRYPDPYQFDIDTNHMPQANRREFQSNFVRTSKYSLISFLPKALLLQFTRLANIYFLVIAILLSIDIISPLNPFTAWAPLIIVIGISMTREGYEDFQRYKSDRVLNFKSYARVIRNGHEHNVKWSEVLVGDVCVIRKDETFPADLILLGSSFENGTAFIQTASLDGEKNLKPRSSFQQTLNISRRQWQNIRGRFNGPVPDPELHRFSATLTINTQTMQIEGDKQLLYRGTKLRNTELAFGLVVYTGKNTKIMKNSQAPTRNKMSQVQNRVNVVLSIILTVQTVLCFVTSAFYFFYRNQIGDSYYYVDWTDLGHAADAVVVYFTYLVLLNTMIPISLIVSIEIVKLFQKYFIDRDRFMYSVWRKQGVTVKSASLNQELGQIEYLFTDKTGTLTKNIMEFKIAAIEKRLFGDLALITSRTQGIQRLEKSPEEKGFRDDKLKAILQNRPSGDNNETTLIKPIIIKNSQGQPKLTLNTFKQVAHEYFLALSLAHQVMAESRTENSHTITIYQGPSPDEISLVEAAKQMGYEFMHSTQQTTSVKVLGREQKFELLGVFPFTSDRKRMSIMVREHEGQDAVIKMYTKGADNVIRQRLAVDSELNLDEELERFSLIGLRTLLIAMRVISQHEWDRFQEQVSSLPLKDRDKVIDELQSKLQKGFYLIGATAVLDRLQDEVPETIRDLIRANIKVWMLTGDKMETAQNIAKSCNLIQKEFHVFRYKLNDEEENLVANPNPQRLITQSNTLNQPRNQQNQPERQQNQQNNLSVHNVMSPNSTQTYLTQLLNQAEQLKAIGMQKSLLIEGSSLNAILASPTTQKLFVSLGSTCQSVICCRLLPSQKRQIVNMVRKHLKKITLAIGDGANDVTMIKQAHIGVGLYGQEGMGAVQAGDYALPEFRMLWRLLLVHGRWNYIRISEMILYFFYKNMLFTIPQFITAFFCAYSGQTLFDNMYVALYNLIFTALPVIVRAVLQQDVNYMFKEKQSTADFTPVAGKNMREQQQRLPQQYHVNKYFYRLFPKIYFVGQENCVFNYKNYAAWMVEGMVEATLLTVMTFFIIGGVAVNAEGYSSDFWLVGVVVYTTVIFVVTFKLSTHTKFWSAILIWVIILTSLGLYLAYTWISNYVFSNYVEGVAFIAWTSGECYFVVLFSVCMILLVDGIVVFVDFKKGALTSRMREIVYEQQINNKRFYDQHNITITSGLTTGSYQNVVQRINNEIPMVRMRRQ